MENVATECNLNWEQNAGLKSLTDEQGSYGSKIQQRFRDIFVVTNFCPSLKN